MGAAQLLMLTGCSGAIESTARAAQASSPQAASEPGAAPAPIVRISRAFFGRPLSGEVQAQQGSANADEIGADVSWTEYPPTDPAPTGPVLADFRDHQGCAGFSGWDTLALCFRVQPDVSSVGISSKDVTLQGADVILSRLDAQGGDANCPHQVKDVKFVSGSHNDAGTQIDVKFLIDTEAPAGCPQGPVSLDLKVSQL